MATLSELKQRRGAAHRREAAVERALSEHRGDREYLARELREERKERENLRARRAKLREVVAEELAADERGEGEHGERWEERKAERLDELADLYESSEARSDRLARKLIVVRHDIKDLARTDRKLERRIERITRQIEARRKDRSGQLTRDFHIREFDCRDGTPVPDYIAGELEELCKLHLQPLRDSGGAVSVNSGYRHAAYNASIGGASQSYHVYELRKTAPAADHIQAGRSAPDVQRWHDEHNAPDGLGYYGAFTHIDDRGYRSRWHGAG